MPPLLVQDLTVLGTLVAAGVGGGGGGGGPTAEYVRRAPFYVPFTPAGDDDEFDDGSLTGWTLVEDTAPKIAITEAHDVCSIVHPGGDTAGEFHALLKPRTVAANDWVEICLSSFGRATGGFMVAGPIMSDGTTYGAGSQVFFAQSSVGELQLRAHTNFSTAGTNSGFPFYTGTQSPSLILRLMYLGSNNWRGYASADGVSYVNITGDLSKTLTPTHAGFFVSSWGASVPASYVVRYCRFGSGTP